MAPVPADLMDTGRTLDRGIGRWRTRLAQTIDAFKPCDSGPAEPEARVDGGRSDARNQ